MLIHMCNSGALQIAEVHVTTVVPDRKCHFPAWESSDTLTPVLLCPRALTLDTVWELSSDRSAISRENPFPSQPRNREIAMGWASCFQVMLHFGAKCCHIHSNPFVQPSPTVPVAPDIPQNMWEWSPGPGFGEWHPSGMGVSLFLAGVAPQWDLLWR